MDDMKKGRKIRSEAIKVIEARLDGSEAIIINDYRGLTVEQIGELRNEIAPLGASLHVQKNNLTKIALENKSFPKEIGEYLFGPSAITYVKGDVSPVLKILFKYSNNEELSFEVKGAYFDETVFDKNNALQISKLPSRDQLLSMVMGTMNAPVQNLAAGLNDVIARFARVLQSVADEKEK